MSWQNKWKQTLDFLFFKNPSDDFSHMIEGAGELKAKEALRYYRDSYYLTLQDVLEGQFPSAFELLSNQFGRNEVKKIAERYVKETPSQKVNLNFYGRSFPDLIEQYISLSDDQLTQLKELMKFELWKDDLERELYPPDDFSIDLYQNPDQKWSWSPMRLRTFSSNVELLEENCEFLEGEKSETTMVAFQTPQKLVCFEADGWKLKLFERFREAESLQEGIETIDVDQQHASEVGPFFQFMASHKLLIPKN